MKPSEAFSELEFGKIGFAHAIVAELRAVSSLLSVTFTGSFVERPGLDGISDVDVVVVVEQLTEVIFSACRNAVACVSPETLGLEGYRLVINDSFGPLKMDEPGVVVVHLMIYSRAGHRSHVLMSPFTCYDWERSRFYFGQTLRRLCPVLALHPRQFFESRRGMLNYMHDLAAGVISYRRYRFGEHGLEEVLEFHQLDSRHQGEYAYHVVRNLVANYAKLLRRENCRLSHKELMDFWCEHLPNLASFREWFTSLELVKRTRGKNFPRDTIARTQDFLERFAAELDRVWNQVAILHRFIRHARTALNDDSYLGSRRDPGIVSDPIPLSPEVEILVASPARRCQQTAASLAPELRIRTDPLLAEIDYGLAEGLTFDEVSARYPHIPHAWDAGEDPVFPEGENTAAVHIRLTKFLRNLPAQPSLVVTHNVVLRCLIGDQLGLPVSCWHRIPVAHLEEIATLQLQGYIHLNLSFAQIERITNAVTGHFE